jgi:uncharacterized membrane protein YkvA (DUF1232 family)
MKQKKHIGFLLRKSLEKAADWGQKADEKDFAQVDRNYVAMKKGPLVKVWDKVIAMHKAFISSKTPASTKILLIGALIYMIVPTDIIPDFLLPAGLLDDAAVIVFIYAQCREILDSYLPRIKEAGKETLTELTDDAVEKMVCLPIKKKFRSFEIRTLLNSAVKLLLFCDALLLLKFSKPEWVAVRTLASWLLIIIYLWLACSIVAGIIRGIKFLVCFIPVYHEINLREIVKPETDRYYSMNEKIAEALYRCFGESMIPPKRKAVKKISAFFFRKWNEGELPEFIPGKKILVERVWNTVKIRVIMFFAVFTGYLLSYGFLVRGMLMKSVTDYTLPELLLYPLVSAGKFLFG